MSILGSLILTHAAQHWWEIRGGRAILGVQPAARGPGPWGRGLPALTTDKWGAPPRSPYPLVGDSAGTGSRVSASTPEQGRNRARNSPGTRFSGPRPRTAGTVSVPPWYALLAAPRSSGASRPARALARDLKNVDVGARSGTVAGRLGRRGHWLRGRARSRPRRRRLQGRLRVH